MIAGDILRATFQTILDSGDIAQNVYHYLAGSGVNEIDFNVMNSVRDQLNNAHSQLNDMTHVTASPGSVVFQKSTDSGATFFDIGERPSTTFAPAGIGEQNINQAAFQINFQADGTGRSAKKYLAGFTEGMSVGSLATAQAIAGLILYGNQVVTDVGVSGGTLVAGWITRSTLTYRPYNGVAIIPIYVSTMRKRKPGVGI